MRKHNSSPIIIRNFFKILVLFSICFGSNSSSVAAECNEIRECMDAMVSLANDLLKKQATLENNIATLEIELQNEIDKREDDLRKVIEELTTKIPSMDIVGCSDPRSGQVISCSCPDNKVLVGIRHHDVPGDKKNTERIVGIICSDLIIN